MVVLATRRAVVQAAIESSYNTAATLTTSDGVLVSQPLYTADPTVLERDFTRDTLSRQPHIIGRMAAKMEFTTELRGNGKQQSGLLTDAPIITRLFRACGYAATTRPAPFGGTVFPLGDHANTVAMPVSGTLTNTDMIGYKLTVDTAGASGVARITVTSDVAGEGNASAIVTTAASFTLGTKGLRVTPAFTGSLAVGQSWQVWLHPAGVSLDPISNNFESITLGMYKDNVFHLMPGSFGTFDITAQSGQYASIKWTFMGTFQNAIDQTMVSPVYEKTLPSQVELARLYVDGFNAIVEKFTFNQGNDVQIRPDVSSAQGYIGTRIVARKPMAGINPEADLVANYDFWLRLRSATRMPFSMRVGSVVGNTVWVLIPNSQYTKMTYADRNGILVYDAGLHVAGVQADDEVQFFFS